jgi:hypothetical protein
MKKFVNDRDKKIHAHLLGDYYGITANGLRHKFVEMIQDKISVEDLSTYWSFIKLWFKQVPTNSLNWQIVCSFFYLRLGYQIYSSLSQKKKDPTIYLTQWLLSRKRNRIRLSNALALCLLSTWIRLASS